MKKTITYLFSLLCLLALASCSKDDHTPVGDEWIDPIFARVLQEKGYIKDALTVTYNDVANLTEIDVRGSYNNLGPIKSVRGIEHFKSLEEFYCTYNQLTTLDISGCTQLTELSCDYNQLTTLDVSGCTQLTKLYCFENKLTTLDVSKNTQLTEL